MKKMISMLFLLACITKYSRAQTGTTMATAINAGNYSVSGSYSDAKSNASGSGFTNNYGQLSADIWYSFTIGGSGGTNAIVLSLCGSSFDTYLHVLNSSGTEIASNDDACGLQSSISLSNLAPGTYYVDAEGYSTNTGTISFSLAMEIYSLLGITYTGPQTYAMSTAVSPLSPSVSGSPLPQLGRTTTFAGTGGAGSTNGTGTGASFNQPLGATIDPSGNLYVAEGGSHLIRKITAAGVVTTLAGTGNQGFGNGTGTAASFYHPVGLASDAYGNIYVADEDNNVIRAITPGGVVTTFAGTGAQGLNSGTVTAGSATFKYPCGVAVDGSGNVYVADSYNNVIRKISGGMVSTFAGNGVASSLDGQGTNATFNQPFSVVTDASGNVYVTDRVGARIRKITPAGLVSTLAGNGTAGYQDGTTVSTTQFNAPTGLAIDKSGNLYVADEGNNRIRKVTPAGEVTTLSGTGAAGSTNGSWDSATFNLPFAMAADAGGMVYSGDLNTNLIRKIVAVPYSVSPALPAGLSLNSATGVISGTPTAITPQATYTIKASNGNSIGTAQLDITVTDAGGLKLSMDQNYILTYTPRVPNLTTDAQVRTAAADINNEQINVQYFDGLGQLMQTVQIKGSAAGRDIVQPVAYDQFGREALKYQPYVAKVSSSDGSYKLTAIADQAAFYTDPTNASTWNSPGVKATTAPFAQTIFETSPLNRVTEQGAPGTDWQIQSNQAGHTLKTDFTTNNEIAISNTADTYISALFRVGSDGSLIHGLGTQYNYPAGQLYVTVSKDENWTAGRGGTEEEYKDKEGHVVLKRTFNTLFNASGIATGMEVLSTYYVYDDLGNLCYVLTPASGADTMIGSAVPAQAVRDGLCYQYKYDERGRMVEKKLPGKGWEYIIYNKLDQIVVTQDANQRDMSPQQASFSKYDALGRVVITGVYNIPGASVKGQSYRSSMQSDVNNQSSLWESRQYVGTAGTTDYTTLAYPQTDFTPLTINYYDNYTAIPGRPGIYTPVAPATYSMQTTGLLTGSRTSVLNSPAVQLLEVHWYDGKGRETGTSSQHYKGGFNTIRNYDAVAMTYNFQNAVTTTTRKHYIYDATKTDAQLKLTVWNRYLYDHMGRKLKTWQQITNSDGVLDLTPDQKTLISKLDYNELGQLIKKNLHTTDTTGSGNFRQTVAYSYNERGWLSTSTSDQFKLNLYYNDAGTGKQYNGNIAIQSWQTKNGTAGTYTSGSYTYSYDQQNRLTKGISGSGYHEQDITYDLMGNIKSLNRFAGNTNQIDQLTYIYASSSNQLSSVTDGTSNTAGQKPGTASYGYDANGNLNSDNSRGITATNPIVYNLLNLPQSIPGLNITYTYDATGEKLRKVVTGTGATSEEYIDGIQYNGTTLDFIRTEEGRAIPKDATGYNYEYSLTDHLGNSRVNFDTGNGTTANQVQIDDYYPFGMDIAGTVTGIKNLYLYNKKELQQNGLNLYDYGARFYDPAIARWTSIDPLAEKGRRSSPFNYVFNNPLRFIDPDGMWGDYYTATGDWLGTDHKDDDKAYVAKEGSYTQKGNGYEIKKSGITELKIGNKELLENAATVYGESSAFKTNGMTDDLKKEMFAIASVHERNDLAYGSTSALAQKFMNTWAGDRNRTKQQLAIAAEINAQTGGFDYSYGATNWDGIEQAGFKASNKLYSNGRFELHKNTIGWNISDDHYKAWGAFAKQHGYAFHAPQESKSVAGTYKRGTHSIKITGGKTGFTSTAVYGGTIFWKQ